MKRVAISLLFVSATLVAAAIAWSSWGRRQAIDPAAEAASALADASRAVAKAREQQARPAHTDPAVVASRRAERLVAESEASRDTGAAR